MPELPEVETIKNGLAPFLINARIDRVILKRKNLRFDFPKNFAQQISGNIILNVSRRAKYLLIHLSNGKTLLSHLGMTGNYRFFQPGEDGQFKKHDHVIFELGATELGATELSATELGAKKAPAPFLVYSDPRRFGFMDLFENASDCSFLKHLGPEPLGNELNATFLAKNFARRRAPVKTVLLDQKMLAGLGNIYVCEALFRAKIHPQTQACSLVGAGSDSKGSNIDNISFDSRLEHLAIHIRQVLQEALDAGGSTLQDFKSVSGEGGYFQHSFWVYGREGEECQAAQCNGIVERMVQSGRSSFFCPVCQA